VLSGATLTFWGVRGSIPSPGVHTVVFGGNTSCVSVEYQDHVLIFDAGTGLRKLGHHLMARGDIKTVKGSVFLTHTHWDHIQGLPFFVPAIAPGNHFTIYGEGKRKYNLLQLIEGQFQHPFFPVEMEDLYQANLHFHELGCHDTVTILPHITINTFRLRHPNAAIGYLLDVEGVRIAYVTDHEHDGECLSPTVVQETSGVDILIHDAQYTREDLRRDKKGWGHSAWEDVVQLAIEARVKQLFLFHHDPEMTDEQLNERQCMAQRMFPQTFVAREGLKIPLLLSEG
jgi:phosphoribosyl 1,2-cyclic phosphodiesterase